MLVSSAAFNLQLGVTCKTFLSSNSLPNAFLCGVAASEREIWFSRGQGFCISFRLLLDGRQLRASDPWDGSLVECFAKALKDAELWAQLHLQASLTLPSHDDQCNSEIPPKDIIIYLNHFRTGVDALGPPQQAAIILPLSNADVKPPSGIPAATINEVQLTLEFSTNSQDPTPRRRAPKRPRTESSFSGNKHQLIPEPSDGGLWPPQPVESSRHEKNNEHFPRPEEMPPLVPLHPDSNPRLLQISQAPRDILKRYPRKRAAEVPEGVATESASCSRPRLEHMILLVDVALRNLVTKKPLRTPPGVVLAGATPEFRLSEVVPSLWSPGYLTAISKRSRFLTVISQTISLPMYNYARSTSLKVKLERLSSLPPSPLLYSPPTPAPEKSHPPSQDHSTSSAIYNVVQARLWRMMQQSLYDPGAARRLKPMKLVSGHEGNSLRRPDGVILEEDDITSCLESLLGSAPDTLSEFDEDVLTGLLGFDEDDLLLGQCSEPISFRHEPTNIENCHHKSIAEGGKPLPGWCGDGNEMLAIELQPIVGGNHEPACEAGLFGAPEPDFSQAFQRDQLYLTEDGDWAATGNTHIPIYEADLFDTGELGAFSENDSCQELHKEEGGEEQLILGGEDIFAVEASVHHPGQQYDPVEEDEMLF
ncbi:MAG: hypothetical protein M1840_006019 [Geoglossum simile]|nr:MAG: hypothetical protein M1840_006019 [Geoglossum simile]